MTRSFSICAVLGLIWVQASEIWRYFVIVKPETVRYFEAIEIEKMTHVDNVLVWGLWGSLLTMGSLLIYRFLRHIYGKGVRTVVMSSLLSWTQFFVLFWVGSANMGLAEWSFIPIPLALSFAELLVLNLLVDKLWKNPDQSDSLPKYDVAA